MTQKVKILKFLRKRPKKGMTNGDGMRILMINSPHKRIAELIDEGIRIKRAQVPDPNHQGCTMTRYWLEDPQQTEIDDYLVRHG